MAEEAWEVSPAALASAVAVEVIHSAAWAAAEAVTLVAAAVAAVLVAVVAALVGADEYIAFVRLITS